MYELQPFLLDKVVRIWVRDQQGSGGKNLIAPVQRLVRNETAPFHREFMRLERRVVVIVDAAQSLGICECGLLEHLICHR